jgi:hypothetical protein
MTEAQGACAAWASVLSAVALEMQARKEPGLSAAAYSAVLSVASASAATSGRSTSSTKAMGALSPTR